MNKQSVGWLGLLFLLCSIQSHAQDPTGVAKKNTREEVFDFASLGVVHTLIPTKGIKSVAIFVDGDGGWNTGISDMAQLLANEGALVAGVDTVPYLQQPNSGTEDCTSIADDFESLARAVEERFGVKKFLPPILAGYSSGATLVYVALVQTPHRFFRGAISLGFCTTLETHRPLCTGHGFAAHHTAEGLKLLPSKKIDAPWLLLHGATDQACTIAEVSAFSSAVPTSRLIPLPKVGHGYAVGRRWQPQFVAAYKELTDTGSTGIVKRKSSSQ